MSILVFAEAQNKNIKKAGLEAVNFGHKIANLLGTECIALTLGEVENAGDLGKYGASKILNAGNAQLNNLDTQVYISAIEQVAKSNNASVVIINHSSTGRSLAGGLSIRLNAGLVSGVSSVPTNDGSFKVKRGVYSGKAIAEYEMSGEVKVLSLMGNSFPLDEVGAEGTVESIELTLPESRVSVKEVSRMEGTVPLPEAELVVSAGRGMKGPENWGIIDDLANVLGATTACSRPVADTGWRPHHEHVGQTGIAIHPNLYIAIGISGAIQHLAGVNNSKVIVVINKDPEAPFFKAADYGVVADLFDVVPKLTESIKRLKEA